MRGMALYFFKKYPGGERSVEIQNKLLASLKSDDLKLLVHQLNEIPIRQGELLEEPGRPLNTVYFPQSGMVSLVVQMPEDNSVEVGTVGPEGAIGMAVGLGSRRSFISALVQVPGACLRIPASQISGRRGKTPLAPPAGFSVGTPGWLLIFSELHPGRPFQRTVQLLNGIVGSLLALELQLDILLRIVGMPYPNHGTVGTHQSLHRHYRPQSSSASCFTAGPAGLLLLIQSGLQPRRLVHRIGVKKIECSTVSEGLRLLFFVCDMRNRPRSRPPLQVGNAPVGKHVMMPNREMGHVSLHRCKRLSLIHRRIRLG
jgi:hypothetical protein